MSTQMLLQYAGILLAIIVVDLALSGDNALVIGAVASKLQGKQRRQAILLGGLMAAVLRIGLSAFAVLLLQVPYLQAIGGVIVFIIAVQMLHEIMIDASAKQGEPNNPRRRQLTGEERLLRAALTILIADFSMSLDNILAIAVLAQGHIILLIVGLALSVVLLLLASAAVAALIERFPILIYLAAGILAWTAGTMVLNDAKVGQYIKQLDTYIPGPLPDYIAPFFLALLIAIYLIFALQIRRHQARHPIQDTSLTSPASRPR